MIKKRNPYTLHLTEEEKIRYETFAKEHNKNTLSSFIREALDAVIRMPSVLEFTENEVKDQILESLSVLSNESNKELTTILDRIINEQQAMRKELQWLMKKRGATKAVIKKIHKDNEINEVMLEL